MTIDVYALLQSDVPPEYVLIPLNIGYSGIHDLYSMTKPELSRRYANIKQWLSKHNIEISRVFRWIDTGNYFPDYVMLHRDDAIIFRLVFSK